MKYPSYRINTKKNFNIENIPENENEQKHNLIINIEIWSW